MKDRPIAERERQTERERETTQPARSRSADGSSWLTGKCGSHSGSRLLPKGVSAALPTLGSQAEGGCGSHQLPMRVSSRTGLRCRTTSGATAVRTTSAWVSPAGAGGREGGQSRMTGRARNMSICWLTSRMASPALPAAPAGSPLWVAGARHSGCPAACPARSQGAAQLWNLGTPAGDASPAGVLPAVPTVAGPAHAASQTLSPLRRQGSGDCHSHQAWEGHPRCHVVRNLALGHLGRRQVLGRETRTVPLAPDSCLAHTRPL